jgi:hypothetical protein
MDFKSKIEGFATHQIISLILDLLGRVSDRNTIRLTYLGERLTSDEKVLSVIAGVRRLLENPHHPAQRLFRRILEYLPSQNRRFLFETLFYRSWFHVVKKQQFEAEHGFWPPLVMILSPTLHCNLRCKGCYTLGYGTKPELPYDLVKRVLLECQVTSQNVEVVTSEPFVDLMLKMGSFAQMYFLYIPVNGRADFSLMVTPEQRNHLRKQVMYFRQEKEMFFLDFWNDGPHVNGCIAGGRRYFHINAKGDVEPCVYTHIAVDNIRNTTLANALDSPLFKAIRARQPHNSNHLRPCMIIDNPHVMRQVIEETNPYFTHPRAEEIYTTKSHEMDAYAKHFAQLADRVWQDEYMENQEESEIQRSKKSFRRNINGIQRDSAEAA